MSGIRGSNTSPEKQIRKLLHQAGFRFRLHARKLPGRPDIVLPKHRAVVFVNGCFWHRHAGCRFAYIPKTRSEFWMRKFSTNVQRDAKNLETLGAAGWRVLVVWECAVRANNPKAQAKLQRRLANWVLSERRYASIGTPSL
jgi:DNA mismatch endonuclease (patch repair protein)